MIDVGDEVHVDTWQGWQTARVIRVTMRGAFKVQLLRSGAELTVPPAKVRERRVLRPTLVASRPSTTAATLAPVFKEETGRSPAYLAWIRTHRCEWCLTDKAIQASHHPEESGGSVSMKCSDYRTLPLCAECHQGFTGHQQIGSMSPELTRSWVETRITRTLIRYIRETGE